MSDTLTPRQTPIAAGEIAPDFTLKNQNREDWNLAEHIRTNDVVLCFYPLDFTGVCGVENECLTREMDRWSRTGAVMVGVSCDSFAAHKAWAEQMGFKHTLLADMHRHVCKAYGLYWPELNVARRGTVVVGKSPDGIGRVKWVQAREPGQAMNFDEVIAAMA
ncbi:MAG: redoxin domain-containing protein [Phycisphaeraceae bacterium]|nr:redoxin domain-containing protein [Phycisphaeraceae bacterium]MCW5755263.1 redoxin domain-containing protein [Phycisphaeraceae bacterium]